MSDFLNALKVGDAVLIAQYSEHLPASVTHRDKVKIIVRYRERDSKFSAKNGYLLGSSGYNRHRLIEATPERLAVAQLRDRRDRAHQRISRARIDQLSVEALEAAADLLDPAPSVLQGEPAK